jgi:hypothetical protein
MEFLSDRVVPKYLKCSTVSKRFITYMYVPILSCILISRREHQLEIACDVIRTHHTNRESCLSENPYRIC